MNLRCRLRVLLLAALTGALSAAAAEKSYDVTGIVREKKEGNLLLIAHDEIPGYMAAMTMLFELAQPNEGAALKANDRVRFRLRPIGDRWLVDRFVVLGQAAAPAPRAASRGGSSRLRAGDPLPAIELLDEKNQPLTLETLRGRFTLVTFIFTRCPVPEFCPAMALRFGELQRLTEKGQAPGGPPPLRLLSITLDPEFDRPDVLAAYGRAVGANPAIWNFATGTKEDIATLTKQFSVFTERNGVTLDHTLCTALIGPDGRILELWRGNGWTAEDVFAFLRTQSAPSR